jgi:hypothetical protein
MVVRRPMVMSVMAMMLVGCGKARICHQEERYRDSDELTHERSCFDERSAARESA